METNKLALDELCKSFEGEIILPENNAYEKARGVFYGGIDKYPALILQPTNAQDIAQAINFAKKSNLEIAVRSGGHSVAGHSTTEGGVVIDLRNMRKLEIDTKSKTAWVESGLTAGEYTTETAKLGLATGFGDTGSVGIGGITLGGGIGFLVRKYGMTIDNLLAAEIVIANGEILQIDKDNHPDLFWAIRGGGGNFGIATKFKLQLQDVDDVFGGMMVLPATPEAIVRLIDEADKAPEELSGIFNIMTCPPMPFVPEEYYGKLIIMILMVCVGENGEKVIEPFRKIEKPIADMLKKMKYSEIFQPEDDSYHPTAASQTMFTNNVDLADAKHIIDRLEKSTASFRVVQLRVLGGVMARVPESETAFAHRKSKILTNIAAFYNGDQDKIIQEKWVKQFSKELNQGYNGAYVGFIGDEGAARVRDAYPEATWKRLVEIKRKYDPENLFRLNQNIN